MEVKKYINILPEEIVNHSRNIYIGISVGNKLFSKDLLTDYLIWATTHTKEKVLVFVADDIHSINLEVFNNYKKERAVKVARKNGTEILSEVQKLLEESFVSVRDKIILAHWADLEVDKEFQRKLNIIKKEWETNGLFREKASEIICGFSERRKFFLTTKQIEAGSEYVLRELPTFLGGIWLDGFLFDLHPYPTTSDVMILTNEIMTSQNFSELALELGKNCQPVGMVELK